MMIETKYRFLLYTCAFLMMGLGSGCCKISNQVDNAFYSAYETRQAYEDYFPNDVKKLHEDLFIADMHADSLLWRRNLAKESKCGHVDFPRLIQGNVALQAFTVVTVFPAIKWAPHITDVLTWKAIFQLEPPRTWFNATERAFYQAEKLHRYAEASDGQFRIIKSKHDLSTYFGDRQKHRKMAAGLLGIEGAHALGGNLSNVKRFADEGFRMMGPTHFFDNRLGGSAHGPKRRGLTSFGRQVLVEMEKHHMLIDLAHASPAMIDDALEMYEQGKLRQPLIVSHTGVIGIAPDERNIRDKHIRGVARTGGIVCIGYFIPAINHLHPQAIAETIYYVISLLEKDNLKGVNHVGLGSDYDGTVKVPFDTRGIALITQELLSPKYGLDKQDIRKIMGGNIVDLLMKVLPEE
ncbi:MAG: dipeptidase [Thermodesulfobacteriota bacterium]